MLWDLQPVEHQVDVELHAPNREYHWSRIRGTFTRIPYEGGERMVEELAPRHKVVSGQPVEGIASLGSCGS